MFTLVSSDFLCLPLSCLLSILFLFFFCHINIFLFLSAFISDPSAPNLTLEAAPSSSGPTKTVNAPSDPSLSPGLKTPEKETQRDEEVDVAPEEETEEEKAIRLLYCSLCKVAVNSASQLQAHNIGERL